MSIIWGSPGGSGVKNPPSSAGDPRDTASTPGLGRSPGGGNGNPLQNSCLVNPMDRGAWRATVHGVAKSRPWLSNWAWCHLYLKKLEKNVFNLSPSKKQANKTQQHYFLEKWQYYTENQEQPKNAQHCHWCTRMSQPAQTDCHYSQMLFIYTETSPQKPLNKLLEIII